MSPMRVTFKRTVGMVSKLYITALSLAVFFAGAATLFAFNLDAAEGTFSALAPLWTVSVSPILPVLAALLGMEVWSDERKTGRIDVLLSSPVRERDFVVGKFLGENLPVVHLIRTAESEPMTLPNLSLGLTLKV
mgnify:CR=1 FL=1